MNGLWICFAGMWRAGKRGMRISFPVRPASVAGLLLCDSPKP